MEILYAYFIKIPSSTFCGLSEIFTMELFSFLLNNFCHYWNICTVVSISKQFLHNFFSPNSHSCPDKTGTPKAIQILLFPCLQHFQKLYISGWTDAMRKFTALLKYTAHANFLSNSLLHFTGRCSWWEQLKHSIHFLCLLISTKRTQKEPLFF